MGYRRKGSGKHILSEQLESLATGVGLTGSERLLVLSHLVRCKSCQTQLMTTIKFLEKLRAVLALNGSDTDELDIDWGRIRLVFGDPKIAREHITRLIVWVV